MHACLALTYELKMILDQAFKAMPKFLMLHFRSFSFHFVVVYLMIYFSGSGLFVRYRSHCSISQLSHLGP